MRWAVGVSLLLLLIGCSIRPVEEPPLDEVELEEVPPPGPGFGLWNQGIPLYSTEGWIPAHYYRDGDWYRPTIREEAYDPRGQASQSVRESEGSIALPQRAPERHLGARLSSHASSTRNRRLIRERAQAETRPTRSAVRDTSRQRELEKIRRQRQQAAREDEKSQDEDQASRRRNERAKLRP